MNPEYTALEEEKIEFEVASEQNRKLDVQEKTEEVVVTVGAEELSEEVAKELEYKNKPFIVEGIGGHPIEVYKQLVSEGRLPVGRENKLKLLSFSTDPRVQAQGVIDSGKLGDHVGVYILRMANEEVKVQKEELTGKTTTVKEEIFKGSRKWTTYHVIYDSFTNEELHKEVSKTDAIKWAKQYLVENSTPQEKKRVYLRVEKHLEGSEHFIVELEPQVKNVTEKKIMPQNRYLYFGK